MPNKIIWIFSAMLILLSCAKEDVEIKPVRKLTNVTPSIVKIGDIVTIEGTGLNCPTCHITFNGNKEFESISASETYIVAVVPTQHDEEVSIVLWDENVPQDTVSINLVGFFPLNNTPTGTEPWGMQALDENIFFVYGQDGLILTDNGGDSWSTLLSYGDYVQSFFFLTKDIGWIVSSKMNHPININKEVIYFTNNGGQSFEPIDTIECRFMEWINKVVFKSPTEGYLLSTMGRIYYTSSNSSFEKVYEFPEDTDFTAGFRSLSVYSNTVMATGEAAIGLSQKVPILVTGKSNVFTYQNVSGAVAGLGGPVGKVQLVSDTEAYIIKGNRLCFSDNTGENWRKRSDLIIHDFYFSDRANGVAITSEEVETYQTIVFTQDNGVNWEPALGLPNISYTLCMAFSGKIGFVGQYHPYYRMWKYVGT